MFAAPGTRICWLSIQERAHLRYTETSLPTKLVILQRVSMVEAAGVELDNVFCLCNLQIIKDRQNPKIDDSQGHRTVIVQSHVRSQAKPQAPVRDIT
jgi:hypothetical protein